MSHTDTFLNLLTATYARHGADVRVVPPTRLRIPLPPNDQNHESFEMDCAGIVEDMRSVASEEHAGYAEQIVFGMMRQLRSRGFAFGTHYPLLSTDTARQVLLSELAAHGIDARFEFPDSLSIALPDDRRGRRDVSDYLSSVEELDEEGIRERAAELAEAIGSTLGMVRPAASPEGRLRTRLYPETAFPRGALDILVSRPFASGVFEVVVVDFPDSIQPLNRADLEKVGLTEEQAFDRAVEGSLSEPFEVSRMDARGAEIVHIGIGGGFYAGSQLHVLDRHLGDAPHGALVVFPSPPVVMAHVLGQSEQPVIAMDTLQEVARRYTADTDKPITDKLFWWRPESVRDGRPRLVKVRVEIDEQTGQVGVYTEDEDFIPVMKSLA
ncbi:hypothetical protein [Nocardiopsis ganjiahuensis]|uniref:hypothetical protein n=1 Tax=Nocardiopsis ganjiahuensis TaxID=239984 RepID=UPI000345EE0E|nr:hypothetical protein [Nocardiopsis ganjiahuensis]